MFPALRSAAASVLALALIAGCASSDRGAASHPFYPATPSLDIDGFTVAEPGVALSGQPDEELLHAARDAGYLTVVNLRTVEEGAAGEALLVSALGIHHVHIPVEGPLVTKSAAAALAETLNSPERRPVLIHCASGQRAAGLYALYLVHHRDVPLHDALDRGAELGLSKAAVRDAVHREGQ